MVFETTTIRSRGKSYFLWLILSCIAVITLNCFSSEKSLPDTTGTAQISGKVVGPDGSGLPNVQITTSYKGTTLQTTTQSNGLFSFKVSDVERGQGFNLQFTKTSFENANQAAVISLPNLKVDIGNVTMYISGGSEITSRKITGQLLDNFSYRPLVGASVMTIDSAGFAVVAQTDDMGKFELVSNYFAMNSSFAVSAYKSNFITRTDLVAVIQAEENKIRNSPMRLYHKFGTAYAYATEDILGTALNGVTVSLTNSNNQQLQCITGVGAVATSVYDSVPLAAGAYCPDLAGISSPITGIVGDNNGGVKFQNDFLLLGTRYDVTMTKTNAGCTSRATNAHDCYRPATTFVDVTVTGDNPISGGKTNLNWDAWIYGSILIQDPYTPTSRICPASGSCPGAGCTCTLPGITVKLYNNTNTYLTETTTDASGQFKFDTPLITSGQTYKITFEGNGIYSRRIGFSDVPNGSPPPATLYQAPSSITLPATANAVGPQYGAGANLISGACSGGAICLTALKPPTHCIMGTVTDYWSGAPIDGATVRVLAGGWSSTTTGPQAATGGFPALGNGQYILQGDFSNTAVDAYDMEIEKTNYTGEILVAKQTLKFTHSGAMTCPGAPFNLDTQLACSATAAGPSGGTNCQAKTVLYPTGVFAVVNASKKEFKYQIKQSYEKFLTEKTGLTISARAGTLKLTSSLPQKAEDYDAMYLHFDDTPNTLANVPEGKWSNHVPVNPLATTCTPTGTTPCSPRVNGVLAESIGTDSRINAWDIKNYVYYHFYAAAPGAYTIQTTGNTDTQMTLISQTGALLGSDDDSGTGSNAKIGPINLLRNWYYVRVKGKNDNVFGFFDVSVTGPTAAESNYTPMLAKAYSTDCGSSGNMVVSWYSAPPASTLYIAAQGEGGSCNATATIQKHGPVGDIIRGRFGGDLRPINAAGTPLVNVKNTGTDRGFFNIIRQE